MEFDCIPDALFHLVDRIANRYAARQVRDVSSLILLTLFDNDDVFHVYLLFLHAGCFKTLFNVPVGMSSPGYDSLRKPPRAFLSIRVGQHIGARRVSGPGQIWATPPSTKSSIPEM